MIIVREGELQMVEDKMDDGLSLGWRVFQEVFFENGDKANCQWGESLDEETARTLLQRING